MQEIRDLSDLMKLLAERPTGALAVEIHPDVHASLAACLQLGLRNLADVPTALPPRLTVEINATKYLAPVIVDPKDFFGYQ